MMIKEQLKQHLIDSVKAKKHGESLVLRGIMSEIQLLEKELKSELNDVEVTLVLQRAIKKCKDPIAEIEKAGLQEQYASKIKNSLAEIEFISKFLPTQLTEEELRVKILDITNATSLKGEKIGLVMKKVMSELKGKAENQLISKVVKDLIEGR